MKNYAPHIYRQRMYLEGIHYVPVNEKLLREFLLLLSDKLGMTIIEGPHVHDLAGSVNPVHKGLEAYALWCESGVQLYQWAHDDFFTLDVYSCKPYEPIAVLNLVKEIFHTNDVDYFEICPHPKQ